MNWDYLIGLATHGKELEKELSRLSKLLSYSNADLRILITSSDGKMTFEDKMNREFRDAVLKIYRTLREELNEIEEVFSNNDAK